MLRKIRIAASMLFLGGITLLFLDFTGTLHEWFGWMAKVQFLPALLALNVGVVIGLLLFTILFGRIYCSIVCPLGVFQDLVSRVNGKKNKYSYSASLKWLRYGVLVLFVAVIVAGIGSVMAFFDPYSAYGRMVSTLFTPIYQWGNNLLAYFAERVDSYAFYSIEIWVKNVGVLVVATATLLVIFILAWRGGRTYCNAICPVGTVLGILSEFSIYKHRIDTGKCNSCGLCARNCKASCIDSKQRTIDYSRCVSCFDCIDKCNKNAIRYERSGKRGPEASTEVKNVTSEHVDSVRRNMFTVAGTLAVTSVLKAQEKKVDGGLAFIEDKKIPRRLTSIVPPGAKSIRNFSKHCTGCQLCVSVCPNKVLRSSTSFISFMQPEVSYERGYCRPECIKCSEVCPAGAIEAITVADKSAIQIGHAVWIEKNCLVLADGVDCGNCARHCPTGAIEMVAKNPDSIDLQKIPVVNIERCIGCGACENLCPARPFSAIYVEGHTMHRTV